MGIRGLSVTIPHKESALKRLNKIDGAVRGRGRREHDPFREGRALWLNTDYRAAMDSLAEAWKSTEQTAATRYLQGKAALVLGAGGAAQAIAYGLLRRGAEVVLASRTSNGPTRWRQVPRVPGHRLDGPLYVSPDILVNCTPLGMHPNVDATPLRGTTCEPSMVVFDTVYNPESTLLVKDARSRSCTVVTGVEMFIRQAALQFKLFTGEEPPPT